MATLDSYAHGQFSWVDLAAHDMNAIGPFYQQLLGWEAVPQDTQGGPPYTIWTHGGKSTAGLGQMAPEMMQAGIPPHWNSYINVDDVTKVVDGAVALGAEVVVPPFQIMNAGKMGIIKDPTGAMLSFWQKLDHGGAEYVNDPGGFCWNELMTTDPDKAKVFFSELFGWEFEKDETPQGAYWTFKNGDRLNGGMMQIGPQMQGVPPHWVVYFSVDDMDAASSKLTQLGGQVLMPPFEVSVGTIAICRDPQGATFNLIKMSVPADQ